MGDISTNKHYSDDAVRGGGVEGGKEGRRKERERRETEGRD